MKRFTLTPDPILIVFLKLTVFRQNSTFKCGGQPPTETKVGGPRPMNPPLRHLCPGPRAFGGPTLEYENTTLFDFHVFGCSLRVKIAELFD